MEKICAASAQLYPVFEGIEDSSLITDNQLQTCLSLITAKVMASMADASDDDFEKVEAPSDSEYEPVSPIPGNKKTAQITPPTSAPSTPYCREKRLQCPYPDCDKAFNRPTRLEEHIRSHTNDRAFKCPYPDCDKDYLRESHLKHHVKSAHTEVRDYVCSHEGCDKSFATGQRLKKHEETHTGPNKHFCRDYPPCNQVFRKKETLQRHIMSEHENQSPFPCTEIDHRTGKPCTQFFERGDKLLIHTRKYHDATRFSCDECITFNAELQNNPLLSEVQKSVMAKEAYFATYGDLQLHNKKEHPPTCPHCSLSFVTLRELTRHKELVHGIVNPNSNAKSRVICNYPNCGKTFSKQGNLTVHIRTTHENRRDFICGETDVDLPHGATYVGCGRDFGSKRPLIDHVLAEHLGQETAQTKKRRLRTEAEGPKPKKSRKDKGIRKTPAIMGYTADFDHNALSDAETDTMDWRSDDESDEGGLDGTTTMVGSMLFDRDGAYRYASSGEQTPVEYEPNADVTYPSILDSSKLRGLANDNLPESFAYPPSYFENEATQNPEYPSAFTLEPEMSNALDPMLFLTTPSQSQYRQTESVK